MYVGGVVDIDARDLPAMKARVPRSSGCAQGSRVLEVGCGGGKMLRTIADHRPGVALFGCDVREPAAVDRLPTFEPRQTARRRPCRTTTGRWMRS